MQLLPQKPLPALYHTTGLKIITGSYQQTVGHYQQTTRIYMAFTKKDCYRYRRFTDKVGLSTRLSLVIKNLRHARNVIMESCTSSKKPQTTYEYNLAINTTSG